MTIETKYNLEDEVWMIYKNRPIVCVVESFTVHFEEVYEDYSLSLKHVVLYNLRNKYHRSDKYEEIREDDIFASKEDLVGEIRLVCERMCTD